ncbi:MAG: putative glycosyltransferase [Planctomycetota bacterium]|nr:putative glycosyltransferase [Planctomycetota bacterium]
MRNLRSQSVAVILASVDASPSFEASVRGFLAEVGDHGEIVVVDASGKDLISRFGEFSSRIRVIETRPGSLAPELWRDGLNSTVADLVAFSTCQMVPRTGWLAAMVEGLSRTGAAGAGGPISPAGGLSPTDRALYLLRYANYLPPVPESPVFDPPGDNAMYRRERLVGLEHAWRDGFWEVEVHKCLRGRGEELVAVQAATVEFIGGVSLGPAVTHRMAHARHFGAGRSRGDRLSTRLARMAMAPAVPPLLLARIVRNLRSRGEPIGPWLSAIPSLGVLLSTWSLGEATGAVFGAGRRPRIAV